MHRLSRVDARRVAVRAQLLTRDRPADLHAVVHGVLQLQLDPTAAVAPSADLVLWSRLGSAYSPQDLRDALDEQSLVEHVGMVRTLDDLALHRAEMAVWPGAGALREWEEDVRDWVEGNNDCRREVLALLRTDGPLPQAELPDTCAVPWRSSGWNDNRNLTMLLAKLEQRGEVAVAGRRGRAKLWDLAERVLPDDPGLSLEESLRRRDERRLSSLGLARSHAPLQNGERVDVGDVGEPAVVEGVPGEWRVDPALLDGPFIGRAALLSPLDRLLHDRRRMAELFEFDYILEMYKPAARRRWGYYALPILYADRLVGKLDANADRRAGVLEVNAVHRDVPFTAAMTAAVDAEIDDLARWLDLEQVRPE